MTAFILVIRLSYEAERSKQNGAICQNKHKYDVLHGDDPKLFPS